MKRKSQAALEFIMTYGWAILVVLIAIGALAYFGVLSPDKFLPSKCVLQTGIACLDSRILAPNLGAGYGNGRVSVVIQNSLGQDIKDVVIGIGDCGNSGAGFTLTNGQKTSAINIDCTSSLGTASKYSGQINVSYTSIDSELAHKNIGTLAGRLE